MRLTSETPNFPWKDRNICYIFVNQKMNVFQVGGGNRDISHGDAYKMAKNGIGKIVAVWPGNYKSDAFLIDELDDYGAAFGLVMKPLPAKLVGYKREKKYDTKISKFVCFYLETGDDFSLSDAFVTQFAMMIQQKFGWKVALSRGFSGGYGMSGRGEIGLYVMLMNHPILDSWGKCIDSPA